MGKEQIMNVDKWVGNVVAIFVTFVLGFMSAAFVISSDSNDRQELGKQYKQAGMEPPQVMQSWGVSSQVNFMKGYNSVSGAN